jgi:hypothetical protein
MFKAAAQLPAGFFQQTRKGFGRYRRPFPKTQNYNFPLPGRVQIFRIVF